MHREWSEVSSGYKVLKSLVRKMQIVTFIGYFVIFVFSKSQSKEKFAL